VRTLTARVAVVLAGLAAGAVAVARADRLETTPLRTPFASFPMTLDSWQGVQEPPIKPAILQVLGVDDYLTRVYTRRGTRSGVGLYVGYWASQRQGDTIHSPQNCLPGAGWEPIAEGRVSIPDPRAPNAAPLTLNRYVIQKGLARQLVVYWYQSHGRIVASEYWGKLYLMLDAARLNRTDAALVRVIVPVGQAADSVDAAEREALDFVRVLLPTLDGFLPN
jgi:EpsI family protein